MCIGVKPVYSVWQTIMSGSSGSIPIETSYGRTAMKMKDGGTGLTGGRVLRTLHMRYHEKVHSRYRCATGNNMSRIVAPETSRLRYTTGQLNCHSTRALVISSGESWIGSRLSNIFYSSFNTSLSVTNKCGALVS